MRAITGVAVLSILVLAGTASAAIVTSSPGGTVVTLDQFAGLGYNFTFGPVDVGGLVGETIIFTSTNDSVLGQGSYGLSGNGSWGASGQVYAGLDTSVGAMTFMFSIPLYSVGGFVNYAPGSGGTPTIAALNSGGTVIESYSLIATAPISTPSGVNAGAYRGISRPGGDIYGFRVSDSYIVLDDLEFVTTAIPEPSTVLLFGLGAGLLALGARRRRLRKVA